ncbi:hypothetical protein BJY52DRAFT_1309118, partial [Lactarius psammicola]
MSQLARRRGRATSSSSSGLRAQHVHGATFISPSTNNVIPTVRANAASSPCQVLTHSEILSQITNFLTAAHATTASTIIWTLSALARAPVAQARLRTALRVSDKVDIYATLELPLLEHT